MKMSSAAKRTIVLASIIMAAIMGGYTAYISVYGYIADYVGASMVSASVSITILSATGAIAGIFSTLFFKKLGLRRCVGIGACMIIAFGLIIGLFPNLISLYIGFAICGASIAFAGIPCVSAILINWFGRNAAPYISVAIGAYMIVSGLLKGLGGVIFEKAGMGPVFYIEVTLCGVVALICAFLIKDKPETDQVPDTGAASEASGTTEAAAPKEGLASIYKNPAVWCCIIAGLIVPFVLQSILSYATRFFPEGGMSVSSSALILTIQGIGGGVFSMIAGKLMTKIGIKAYAFLVILCGAGIYVFALLYAQTPSMGIVIPLVICMIIGYGYTNLYAVVAPQVFSPAAATEVTSKALVGATVGNMFVPVLLAAVWTAHGFSAVWIVSLCACILAAILYALIFAISKIQKTAGK